MTIAATGTENTEGVAGGTSSAASTTEADPAAKVIADKATADAAAAEAAKTPEQKAADQKVVDDKAAADKVIADAAEAAKKVVPDKYELKLPDNAQADPAVIERTGAIARDLGLSQEAAQKALEFVASETAQAVSAQLAQFAPPTPEQPEGGAKWREQDDTWRAASLADKELGSGDPAKLQSAVTAANKVVAKFGDKDLIAFFEKSGLGSNPATLRFLNKIGKQMSEGTLITGDGSGGSDKSDQARAERIYDHPTSKKK